MKTRFKGLQGPRKARGGTQPPPGASRCNLEPRRGLPGGTQPTPGSYPDRVDLTSAQWTKDQSRWYRQGWVIETSDVLFRVQAPGQTKHCASFCLLEDAKLWADRRIQEAHSS